MDIFKDCLLDESKTLKTRVDQGDFSSKTLNRLSTVLDLLYAILVTQFFLHRKQKSNKRQHEGVTHLKNVGHKQPLSKAEKFIELKIQNPNLNHKQVAEDVYPRVYKEKINYSYARRIWAKYLKNLVTGKGTPFTPFPFMVQNFGRYCLGLPSWYLSCPVVPSSNRNLQKVYKTNYFSVIFHKNGSVFVYDYHVVGRSIYGGGWVLGWILRMRCCSLIILWRSLVSMWG